MDKLEIFKRLEKRIISTFHYKGLNSIEDVNKNIFDKPQNIIITLDETFGVIQAVRIFYRVDSSEEPYLNLLGGALISLQTESETKFTRKDIEKIGAVLVEDFGEFLNYQITVKSVKEILDKVDELFTK